MIIVVGSAQRGRWVLALSIVLLMSGILGGCSGYHIRVLKSLNKDTAHYKGKSNGVKVYVARLNKKEIKQALGRSVPLDKVVALQVTVRNVSPYTISFSRKHVSLPLLTANELVRLTERSVMGPMLAGFGVAMVASAATADPHDRVKRVTGDLASAAAMVGGTAAAVDNASQNDDFAINVSDKLLNEETLWPGEEITKLLFVARTAYRMPFTIRLLQLIENTGGHVVEKRILPFKVIFSPYILE